MPPQTFPPQSIEPHPAFAGILREDVSYSYADADEASNRINGWFDLLMIQSGWNVSPPAVLMLCLLSAVTVGGGLFVIQENLLTTAFGLAVGFIGPIGVAMGMRVRRQSQMLNQMPGVVEELARAARTGRSLEQCWLTVAEDTPDPLGGELRICARRLQMGVDLGAALEALPDRTGLVSMNILQTTLAVHQQTGGDLVHVLERLSRTIRDRLLFLGRLRAATVASRATAVLMIALPPAILTFFVLREPTYFQDLIGSTWGRRATVTAVALQVLGTAWVLRILHQTRRG